MIKITVTGSLSKSEDMKKVKELLQNVFNVNEDGLAIYIPCEEKIQCMALLDIQMLWYDHIKNSDFVVVIPKKIKNYSCFNVKDGPSYYEVSFGEGTSYEMAIAKNLNKPIFIFDNLNKEE